MTLAVISGSKIAQLVTPPADNGKRNGQMLTGLDKKDSLHLCMQSPEASTAFPSTKYAWFLEKDENSHFLWFLLLCADQFACNEYPATYALAMERL